MISNDAIIRRVEVVARHGFDGSEFFAWSTGERLIVALVIARIMRNRTSWGAVRSVADQPDAVLAELGWTRDEAIDRWAGERFGGDTAAVGLWIDDLAAGFVAVAS